MKVAIFTEDSGVKYPEIDEYKDKLGRGRQLEDIPGFLEILKENNLDIPSDDLEDEGRYREVLDEYLRPSILMFSGMFSEIRGFYEKIEDIVDVDLYVISGRYGLVKDDEKIIPYDAYVENKKGAQELDERTNFSKQILEIANDVDLSMFFMATRYIQHIIDQGLLKQIESEIIVVSGKTIIDEIDDIENVTGLKKRGVARISWQNRNEILELLEGSYD